MREELLVSNPFSCIVEGSHSEFDSLAFWMARNVSSTKIEFLYYGKTNYDFGIAEYFFSTQDSLRRVVQAVPNIYTLYPHSLTPDQPVKSFGYEHDVTCNPNDGTAIIIDLTTNQG